MPLFARVARREKKTFRLPSLARIPRLKAFPSKRAALRRTPYPDNDRMPRCACFGGFADDREEGHAEPAFPCGPQGWPEATAAFSRGFDERALRVLTWNLQLLPGVFAGQGGCPASLESRARRIVANVLALARATRVDVVAFQEAWHEGATELLCSGLRAFFPNQHRPAAYCGLVTMTRPALKHACAHFTPFRNVAGVEGWWFTKGVAAVVVRRDEAPADGAGVADEREGRENPTLRTAAVLNAHAQSDFWNSGADVRASQMREIRSVVSRGFSRDTQTVVLVGDLNVVFGTEEYSQTVKILGDPKDVMISSSSSTSSSRSLSSSSQDQLTFPIGKYVSSGFREAFSCFGADASNEMKKRKTFGGYERKTPVARLDYVFDVSATVDVSRNRRRGETVLRKEGTESGALVLRELAHDRNGLPLSDHAPIFAIV